MIGIEILSQELVKEPYTLQLVLLLGSLTCALFLFIIATSGDIGWCFIATLTSLGIALFVACSTAFFSNQHYEYKVLIDPQTNFTEFYEKYEVISQQGKIYTIREKENK